LNIFINEFLVGESILFVSSRISLSVISGHFFQRRAPAGECSLTVPESSLHVSRIFAECSLHVPYFQRRTFLEGHEESTMRWQRGELIGAGAFGRVYIGMNEDTGELLAVKQVMILTIQLFLSGEVVFVNIRPKARKIKRERMF
jgi:hypothetical protein